MVRLFRLEEMLDREKRQQLGHLAEKSLEASYSEVVAEDRPPSRTHRRSDSWHRSACDRQPGRHRGAAASFDAVLRLVLLVHERLVAEVGAQSEPAEVARAAFPVAPSPTEGRRPF